MIPIGRLFVAAIVSLPAVCYGDLTWDFEDSAALPSGWFNVNMGGTWSIADSEFGVGSGKVLRAVLNAPPPADPTLGHGAEEGEVNIDTYTPEFRFQDIQTAELNFNFDMDAEDDMNFRDALQVALFKVAGGNLQLVAELWGHSDRFGSNYPLPIRIADPLQGGYDQTAQNANDHVDGETVYRIRLRVFDGDTFLMSLIGAEVDHLELTSAISNVPYDYSSNFAVDAADYTVWRDTLGLSGTLLAADGDRDGIVDDDDYGLWKSSFGETADAGAVQLSSLERDAPAFVPEPQSMSLLAGVILCLAGRPAAPRSFAQCENPPPSLPALDCQGH